MKPSVKYQVIFKHKDKYSINSMCKFFEVSRSGYYAFLKRMDIPDRDLPLAEKIRECQEESHRTYGYRRVHIWLERQGIHKEPKTVGATEGEQLFPSHKVRHFLWSGMLWQQDGAFPAMWGNVIFPDRFGQDSGCF